MEKRHGRWVTGTGTALVAIGVGLGVIAPTDSLGGFVVIGAAVLLIGIGAGI